MSNLPINGIYVILLFTSNKLTKFEANVFIFGYAIADKPGKADDATVLKRLFCHVHLMDVNINYIIGIPR